jgi:chromosome segregation protein
LKNLQKKRHVILQTNEKTTSEIEKLRNTQESAKESFYRDQSELELFQGRLSFLKNVVENQEGLLDGAKRILEIKPKGLLGILADQIDTDDKNRLAIETGLGESARYLVFQKTEDAFSALEQLRKRGGGKVAMVGLDQIKKNPQDMVRPSLPKKDTIVGWADNLVTCKSTLRPAIQTLLGDILIVKNLSAAKDLLPLLDERVLRVVTLSGELVTGWGVLQIGSSEGEEVGLVGRQKRIKELENQIQQLKEKINSSENRIEELKERFIELNGENEKIQSQLLIATQELEYAVKERDKANFELESAENGLQSNIEERQRLLSEIEKGKVSLEDLRPKMEALTENREHLEKVTGQIQADVERLEEEERGMEEDVHRHNLSVVRLNGEARNLDLEIQRSEGLIKEIQETIQHRVEEIKKTEETITVLKQETENNEKLLIHDYKEKEDREKQQDAQERTYQDLKEEMDVRDKEVRQVRRDREQASEQIHQIEMKISDLEHQAGSLKNRIWESYEVHLDKAPIQEEMDLEEAEMQIADLKRRMKGLGAVNLMALEEYEQESERLTFLQQQRDDLLSAKETLKETILKINKTARKRFEDVFGEVRKNFKETFTQFFQGGEADLRISEDEDPLEAQVEIVARPAGKHFRDLSLLSGGERALTAISLLFALYLVKPSPFCILDEIDAPLDDANVRRFTRVLKEFSEKTQFIIVTHNKMTMRAANTLYGVTMEEEGVSRIVSVKFEEKEMEKALSQN